METIDPIPPTSTKGHETQGAKNPEVNLMPVKMTPILKFSLGFLTLVLFLLLLTSLISKPLSPPTVAPSPVQLTSTQPSPVRQTSDFSKTEAFMRFEESVAVFQKSTAEVDLSEDKLAFPLLDMDVTYD